MEVIHHIEKIQPKGWLSLTIYQFPDKKKKSKTRKQELIKQSIENAGRLIDEYDPKKDPALKASRRKLRDIWSE